MEHRVWAEISPANLRHNLNTLRSRLPDRTSILPVVKSDAYGHGIIPIAHELMYLGVTDLGVAHYEEAEKLRDSGVQKDILILAYTPAHLSKNAIHLNLTQSLFDTAGGEAVAKSACELNRRAKVHIKIDTGMGRLGFMPCDTTIDAICSLAQNPNLDLCGIYSHCATSDEIDTGFMEEQHERFSWVLSQLKARGLTIPISHMANSGAYVHAVCDSQKHLLFDKVRLGILLYGLPPSYQMADMYAALGLRPVMSVFTRIAMIKELPEGYGISYNHTYKTTRPSRIAILTMGYADGYPRRLSNTGIVQICGKAAPIVGSICMDQMMVDVTDIPEAAPNVVVQVIGPHGDTNACHIANMLGTISYEVLCGMGRLVSRVYVPDM